MSGVKYGPGYVEIPCPVPLGRSIESTLVEIPNFASPREFALFTREAVLNGAWDQTILGAEVDSTEQPCDVGTKLAIAFGVVSSYKSNEGDVKKLYWSWKGCETACTALNVNRQGFNNLFRLCGVPKPYLIPSTIGVEGSEYPVDPPPTWTPTWFDSREVVWNRLSMLGVMPMLTGKLRLRERLAHLVEVNNPFWIEQFGCDVFDLRQPGRVAQTFNYAHQLWSYLDTILDPNLPFVGFKKRGSFRSPGRPRGYYFG